MEEEYAVFPVEIAKQMLAAFRALQSSGMLGPGRIEDIGKRSPVVRETPNLFRNDSDETIPPYACIQVIGTVEYGPQNYFLVDKPADTTGAAGAFLFNSHREVKKNEYGTAQSGRTVRAIKDTGTATAGDRWQPIIDDWTIEQNDSGQLIMAGDDDIATDVARVFMDNGSGTGSIEYQIQSLSTGGAGPYLGLTIASVIVRGASCGLSDLIGDTVDVVDHSGCIFDLVQAELEDVWGWADKKVFPSLAAGAPAGTMTPCHWSATNRCCSVSEGG